jgi:hypothetical protein
LVKTRRKTNRVALVRNFLIASFVALCVLLWVPRYIIKLNDLRYDHAVPPSRVQTFDDFLSWQPEIRACREVDVRGITYFHVIGPIARTLNSGGALYVFDTGGNYVGWSKDVGDVMRKEAIFYPDWWLPDESTVKEISLDELKARLSERSNDASPQL